MKTLRQIYESFLFAWKALRSNVMRTILSLLGVTIGIFTIILVLTAVDSLEQNVRDSFNFIGTGTLYLGKRPWLGEPNGEFHWWDYMRRPTATYSEYKFLEANLKHKSHIAIYAIKGNMVVKQGNNSIGQVVLRGGGEDYDKILVMDIERGRYFTADEIAIGRNVAVLGSEVAKTLFPNDEDPIGKTVKIKNLKYIVVGTVKKEGESMMGMGSNDYVTIIPYHAFRKLFQTGNGRSDETESFIAMKGYDSDIGLVELESEVRGYIRSRRGVRPTEKDNFAINRPEALANMISGVFDVFNVAGWIIGGFSILVGGFGIANIMFVSVKERTSIIGVQKSLGAKNYFILFQFLFEAIFLSLIGGLAGLFLVYLITLVPIGMETSLSVKNMVVGIGVSTVIGLVAGIVPAALAARMDPVAAIRAT